MATQSRITHHEFVALLRAKADRFGRRAARCETARAREILAETGKAYALVAALESKSAAPIRRSEHQGS